MKKITALAHADTIEAIAFLGTYIVVAEEIVRTGRRDRDHLRAGRKPAHVLVVTIEADKIGADRRGREQRRVEIGFAGRCRHTPANDCAFGKQIVPGDAAILLAVECWLAHLWQREARAQHQPCRVRDRAAHRARRDGCTRDEIGMQRGRRTAADGGSGFAGKERVELRLADRIVHHIGLGVEDDLRAGDATGHVDTRDHVERHARIAGRAHHIERREQVGHDLVALVDRDARRRAFLRAEPLGARHHHREHIRRQPLAQRCGVGFGCAGKKEKREQEADHDAIIRARSRTAQSATSPFAFMTTACRSISGGRVFA